MEHLLSTRNLKILESFCFARTLFAFDYDGTLAPIVDDPNKAKMSPLIEDRLVKFSKSRPIAIITGRRSSDIEMLLPFKPNFVIGNHGAEGAQSEQDLLKMKELCERWLFTLKDALPVLKNMGITLEDKTYSLSFHFRTSRDMAVAEGTIHFFIDSLPFSRVTKGKCVVNVMPEFSIDKGQALTRILNAEKFQFGVYFGDDKTDEDVFRRGSSRLLTVKIGNEISSARYFLNTQNEMEDVLGLLINFCR
jgi:trehalose 6-phosphate phosphatase